MLISELIIRVQEAAKNRTPDENFKLLKEAHILDENGMYDSRYFSKKTVKADIKQNRLKGNVFK